jgi:hypothetical protein
MSLTVEDKDWLNGQLDTRFARLTINLEGNLDAKLERLESNFDAKLDRLETSFDAKLERLETRFDAKLERVETTLLTEFQKWASPHEARIRTHSATLRAIDLELESVSDRVTKLEDQPPH